MLPLADWRTAKNCPFQTDRHEQANGQNLFLFEHFQKKLRSFLQTGQKRCMKENGDFQKLVICGQKAGFFSGFLCVISVC